MRPSIILTFCVAICFDFAMTKKGYQGKDCLLIICTFDSTDVSISFFFSDVLLCTIGTGTDDRINLVLGNSRFFGWNYMVR